MLDAIQKIIDDSGVLKLELINFVILKLKS